MRNRRRRDNSRTPPQTVQLVEALDMLMARTGNLVKSREHLAGLVWPEVVGDWYAQHTEVTWVEGGVVTVHCDSAPRAQQLQLDAPEILRRLNARLGGQFLRELRPTSGGIRRLRTDTPEESPAPPPVEEIANWPLSAEEQQGIAGLVGEVPDEALRAKFERLLWQAFRMAAWQRAHGWVACARCERLVEPGQELCVVCDPGRQPMQGETLPPQPPPKRKPWRLRLGRKRGGEDG